MPWSSPTTAHGQARRNEARRRGSVGRIGHPGSRLAEPGDRASSSPWPGSYNEGFTPDPPRRSPRKVGKASAAGRWVEGVRNPRVEGTLDFHSLSAGGTLRPQIVVLPAGDTQPRRGPLLEMLPAEPAALGERSAAAGK